MALDLPAILDRLSAVRPVFHSEADFQHALAWQIQLDHPDARVRLETRPERGIRLDLLVIVAGERTAIELKYLVTRFDGDVSGEHFELPSQAAQDISRYDFIRDIGRVERFVADGYADVGWAIALTNDQGYWKPGLKPAPVDAAFRIHDGRVLAGELRWSELAGAGTMRGRLEPHLLRGDYTCAWRDYSTVTSASGRGCRFRYLSVRAAVNAGNLDGTSRSDGKT